jgi:hypothetical protein
MLSCAAGFNFNGFFLYIVSAPVFVGVHLGLGRSSTPGSSSRASWGS